jgi:hypothetical protein
MPQQTDPRADHWLLNFSRNRCDVDSFGKGETKQLCSLSDE